MTPRRRFQSIWFSLILIVPRGLASCSSPGQPFSRQKDIGVNSISEGDAARAVHYLWLSFPRPEIFHMLPLKCAGPWEEFFSGDRLNSSTLDNFCWSHLLLLLARRCASSSFYAGIMWGWGFLSVVGGQRLIIYYRNQTLMAGMYGVFISLY